ncbi:MAG: hypothetical protein ACRED5_19210 [Propylenella sp.]
MCRFMALAALCLAALALPAHAGELRPLGAESIELGGFRGVVYYTSEDDGYRVVATMAEGDTGPPVRFVATLAENQSLTISIPGKVGEPGQEVEISRVGEKLLLRRKPSNHTLLSAKPQVLGK